MSIYNTLRDGLEHTTDTQALTQVRILSDFCNAKQRPILYSSKLFQYEEAKSWQFNQSLELELVFSNWAIGSKTNNKGIIQ